MLKIDAQRLKNILESMKSRKILVVGDLMLDEYIWGKVERISPEAPVPVVDVREESMRLGGAGNVAKNLVGLGASASVASVIGEDRPGRLIMELLEKKRIDNRLVLMDAARKSSVKTRIIAHTQQVVRVDKEIRSLIEIETRDRLLGLLNDAVGSFDAIIISDYGKGVISRELIEGIVSMARKKDVPVNVDPKERNFSYYVGVDLVTPNTKELGYGTSMVINDEKDIVEAASRVKSRLGCSMVLVTRGEHGMSLLDSDGRITHIPTSAKSVYDVTGAGDTVIACFTLAMASGATPVEAAVISNTAAGIVVAEIGAVSAPWDRLYSVCMEECVG